MKRYERQICLPEIGREGQDKLKRARIVVIGMGGLGCPASLYLASAGVGTLVLIDGDRVDESNLPRQILFQSDDVGRLKVEAALLRLSRLNPETQCIVHSENVTAENAQSIFCGADVVIDGTDNFPAKFLINDAGVKFGIPVVWGAATGFDGQMCVFGWKGGACYRCYSPEMPRFQVQSCEEAGVLGPVPGVIGALQAIEAIKIIVSSPELKVNSGELVTFSAKDLRFFRTFVERNPSCICSHPKGIELQNLPTACEKKVPEWEITKEALSSLRNVEWIDVREPREFELGSIPGARNIPLSLMEQRSGVDPSLKPGSTYVCICQRGSRSLRAVALLRSSGAQNVWSLVGGYQGMNQKNVCSCK